MLALLALQEAPVEIRWKPVKGLAVEIRVSAECSLEGTFTINEEQTDFTMQLRRTREVVSTLVEVADGRVSRRRVDGKSDLFEHRMETGDPWERAEWPLHGRTVTVALKDGARVYEGCEKLDERARDSLPLDDEEAALWPAKAVTKGDSWKVERAAWRGPWIEVPDRADLELTLADVREQDGVKVAVLAVKTKASGTGRNNAMFHLETEGQWMVRLSDGVVLRQSEKGTMRMTRSEQGVKIDAKGPVEIIRTSTVK